MENVLVLRVERRHKKALYTIGKLFNGTTGQYICDTCEDIDRDLYQGMSECDIKKQKIYGETAIPRGTYEVVVSRSPKFGKDLPLILNVPGYEGVRIHGGRNAADSLGCVLVGRNTVVGGLTEGIKYSDAICRLIKEHNAAGGRVFLSIC